MNIDQPLRVKSSGLSAHISNTGSFKRALLLGLMCVASSSSVFAQNSVEQRLSELRWKSESTVKSSLGEPASIRGPIGTHASYALWNYEDLTVAFADGRVFHVFNSYSMNKETTDEDQ